MGYDFTSCELCPRKCKADRINGVGFCGETSELRAAKAYLHKWEEPCLSGENGAGTVFFSGCSLKCVFCQNYRISSENLGLAVTSQRLGEIFLELQSQGAHNIELVSPTHFVPQIISSLDLVKDKLKIPVVYNTGGYERIETLKMLDGYIDVYLPDYKYYDGALAEKYSSAHDYPEVVTAAIAEMVRQTGKAEFDENGLIKKGVIIRHLALPNHRHDSVAVLEDIARRWGTEDVLLSLMSQYTPFYRSAEFPEISRRISTFEYNFVLNRAEALGFKGYMQERSSAKEEYTPDFDFCGIKKQLPT